MNKRELKFRAWNTETKKMMQWSDIKKFRNFVKLIGLNHIDIQQYTGLKDMHGNEIYEGDIINLCQKRHPGENDINIVFFENGSFMCKSIYRDESFSHHLFDIIMSLDYEIIGNIYENEELLTNK